VAAAEAGFAPEVRGLREGYLLRTWQPGRPLRRDEADPARFAEWLRHVRDRAAPVPVRFEALVEMVAVNTGEGLGETVDISRYVTRCEDAPACAIDGHLAPHEWIRGVDRTWKVDGWDHCADHFFPGFQDLAWDLAGLGAEWSPELATEVAARLDDPGLVERLPVYDVAYAAFRLGYATLAAGAVDADEAVRWRAEQDRYRDLLRAAFARLA
jgi:hypothetical protein